MKLHQHRHIVLPMLLVIAAFLPLSAVKAQADSAYWNARFLQLLRWTYVDSSLAAIYLPYELEGMSNESGDTHTKLQTKNYTPIRWYGYRFQPSDQWPVVFQVAIGDGPEQTLTLPALEQLAQWGAFLTNDDHRRLRITRRQERDESLRQDTLLRRQLDSLDCIARALRIEADSIQASLTADSLETVSRQRAEEIAQAVADKSHARIVPYGDQAAYLVGLSSLQFLLTYLTDGAPRTIRLSNGRTIEFRHTSEMRIFAFRSRKMQLISNALRALGRENIKAAERETLKWHLDGVPMEDFEADIQLCPEWVRDILLDLKVN